MKLTLLFLALLLSGNLFGQIVEIKRDRRDIGMQEKLSVLKSDNKIKDGHYAAYAYYSGQLINEGFYKNNIRDSIWSSYDYEGKLEIRYDYTHKKLVEFNPPKYMGQEKKYNVIKGKDTLNTTLDQPPIFMDGANKISQLFRSNLHYPKLAKETDTQGKVLIAFTIDTLGNIANFRIKRGLAEAVTKKP